MTINSQYPRLNVYLDKLIGNASTVVSLCRKHGVTPAFVGKCIAEDPVIVPRVLECGFGYLADSRLENLVSIETGVPKMLLRIGSPSTACDIVRFSDISLQSEKDTIRELQRAAEDLNLNHKVILMIDLGDLREGIYFAEKKEILSAVRLIQSCPNLTFFGIGTNLTCYGSIVPDERNLGELCQIAELIEQKICIDVPIVSGGNSSSLALLAKGPVPKRINNLRIGEAVLLGTDTSVGSVFDFLSNDAFILEAELIEVKKKPSFPYGTRSVDAFGKTREYVDTGIMNRGLLNIGRQDLPIDDLIPVDSGIRIIGGSSDHLIVDLGNSKLRVGNVIAFKLKYGALLGAYTSRYVKKVYH